MRQPARTQEVHSALPETMDDELLHASGHPPGRKTPELK